MEVELLPLLLLISGGDVEGGAATEIGTGGKDLFGSMFKNKFNSPNSTDSSNSSNVPLHSL